ncbi:uncharacterized protein EV154DRAFT_501368 [Mucor mucedo]|uniref:uncharacterized protein n=1 Tax=Mucor mucedo TaxID=29922 RepID=UPI00222002C9|nr:uncharacterized protein EV154DRAFT_501368 [Mucor mucedo]KAI7893485.1 hypothetical protein EV154DRAFT_501368 [Mucor mucedo]
MANKSNAKRKGQKTDVVSPERQSTVYDDIESLQITFYEIESWIEKTTPMLSRMTKDLEKASGHFDHNKRKKKSKELIDQNMEQQLIQLQQQQLLWKKSILCKGDTMTNSTNNSSSSSSSTNNTVSSVAESLDAMQWRLSFQPGNLLRLDTNITSVEQLIEAVQRIRLLQAEEPAEVNGEHTEEEEMSLDLCNSPASSATSQPDVSYVEYWFTALGRRPKICLENYKHCRMNLNGLTKNISPQALNYIGQVSWDCLHPKFSLDWSAFWDREGDAKRNQVCIDSGLATIFLHVMRHDKDICDNAEQIAGFYYDRARDALMEFFDDPPDCATIESLLNLSTFCIVCKRYSQARIYIGLALHMIVDCGIHRPEELDDILTQKKYYELLLVLYANDFNLAVFIGEPTLVAGTEINVNFYNLVTINEQLLEMNKTDEKYNFDNNKAIVKQLYSVYMVELGKISADILALITRGASKKQLLAQEKLLTQWRQRLPDSLRPESHDYEFHQRIKSEKEKATVKDITSVVDAETLEAQASLMLNIQYEAQWMILHKAVLTSIRSASPIPTQLEEETRSSNICSNAADTVVTMAEIVSRCFGWCVCQQFVTCIYHASTVYCGQALVKDNVELRNKAKEMIHRIMRILDTGGANHEGFPDDMTECLCEFLTNHGMHNDNVECSCSVIDDISAISTGIVPTLGPLDGVGMINNRLLPPTHKHLKKLKHLSSMVIHDP